MQRPMPSKPALIVKITLQQVTMTNVQCQDLVLPPMCPATRTNTTVDFLNYVLKRTTTAIGQEN